MDLLRTALEQQPLMALFLTIAVGALLGEITVKGFSLGVGAVLFVALAGVLLSGGVILLILKPCPCPWGRRSACLR